MQSSRESSLKPKKNVSDFISQTPENQLIIKNHMSHEPTARHNSPKMSFLYLRRDATKASRRMGPSGESILENKSL